MRSRWAPAARVDLVDRLAAQSGADIENLFVAHGLGSAYQKKVEARWLRLPRHCRWRNVAEV
jgi:hypothetical protein